MVKREIIKIDEEKCTGCGLCVPNCPEGALQIIDGKARLVSDLFCDGLGACIGNCPEGAIQVEEREAEEYDERKVMENIVKQGKNTINAHLQHLKDHGADKYLKQARDYLEENGIENPMKEGRAHGGACPGSKIVDFSSE
ncbi:MAG: 4Fe-4S binding protein, partial [Candidatus Methanofastidiosa archaeon]|nr:4Fe-4S binding protein [Candidatus Methanofastidiosa archaeon]